ILQRATTGRAAPGDLLAAPGLGVPDAADRRLKPTTMLKKYLITGLLIWVPLAFTLWVLDLIVSSMDRTLLLLPPPWRPESWLGFPLPGAGLLLSALVLLLTGMAAANIMGQRLVQWWEGLLSRIPIVRSIYSSVKQVSDTLLSPGGRSEEHTSE